MQAGRLPGVLAGVREIYRIEGVRGFYVGFLTTVAREVPFAMIQYPLYESLKVRWARKQQHPLSPLQAAACGSAAGGFAGVLTTPLDLIKTRLMLGAADRTRPYRGPVECAGRIVREEGGPWALFKGWMPRTMWISLGGFVFFGAYEGSQAALGLKEAAP